MNSCRIHTAHRDKVPCATHSRAQAQASLRALRSYIAGADVDGLILQNFSTTGADPPAEHLTEGEGAI